MKEFLEHLMESARYLDEHGVDEEKFIAGYIQLTGVSQSQARNIYILLGIVSRKIVYPMQSVL